MVKPIILALVIFFSNQLVAQEVFLSIPNDLKTRSKSPDNSFMDKKLFIQVILQLRKIEDRRDFMAEEI